MRFSSGESAAALIFCLVGMTAWWSVTFLSSTWRLVSLGLPAARIFSMKGTYGPTDAARTCASISSATDFERWREEVRG